MYLKGQGLGGVAESKATDRIGRLWRKSTLKKIPFGLSSPAWGSLWDRQLGFK
jgi:hypothetical protein